MLLRLTPGSSAAQITPMLGGATTAVHSIHSRFALEGEAIFDLKPKGGRKHQYLTPEDEAGLRSPFVFKNLQAVGDAIIQGLAVLEADLRRTQSVTGFACATSVS